MVRRLRRLLVSVALTAAVPSLAPAAYAAPADSTAADTFRTLCVANAARMEPIAEAARKIGFVPLAKAPPPPAGMTKILAMQRTGTKQLILVSIGKSPVGKGMAVETPVRSCAVTDLAENWDAQAMARAWVGVPPLLDVQGMTIYSYFERPAGNVAAPDGDLPKLIAGINAGELRTLAVADRDGTRTASWVVFEVPPAPIAPPVAAAAPQPSHDTDPFAPCRWEDQGKPGKTKRGLSCPDKAGKFRSAYVRSVTEQTPALAAGGDAAAMMQLATFYTHGPEAVVDRKAAFGWSKRAAEAGAPGGAFNTGRAYEEGTGTPPNNAEAIRWYRAAADRGHAPAMVNLAGLTLAEPGADPAAAAALVRRAADAGLPVALFDMGYLSENGIGVAKDMAEAQRWYRLAADRKDSTAMLRLGLIEADGLGGVPQNPAAGARWLAEGARSTVKLASLFVGMEAFVYGFDDPRRRAEAVRGAASDPAMALRLGIYLADPNTRGRNPAAAIPLLQIAADAGIPLASMRIGLLYADGDGVAKSDAEAIRWLRGEAERRGTGRFQRATAMAETPNP